MRSQTTRRPCTLLDPESLRIAVSLRLGTKIYRSHQCCYGTLANEYVQHGLKCLTDGFSVGNDLSKRALLSNEIPSMLKPVDIVGGGNSSRVDGVTTTPWSCRRQLAWDTTCTRAYLWENIFMIFSNIVNIFSTCTDPQCTSNIKNSSEKADKAVQRNMSILSDIIDSWLSPLTVCGWSDEDKLFPKDLRRRMLVWRSKATMPPVFIGTIPPEAALNEVN